MSYTGSVPDTTSRTADWRHQAACVRDPDAMFPGASIAEIEYAKAICRECPVTGQCARWALENRMAFGVWGGLGEDERRAILRRRGRGTGQPRTTPDWEPEERRPPHTFESLWSERAVSTGDGHMVWTGAVPLKIKGRSYTPRQVAFRLDRGRLPVGRVLSSCGRAGCVDPGHFADNDERAVCGTRAGYQRHLKNGEPVDEACREANSDADNRLRRTGTTKAVA